jgi:hypothetical protein
MISQRRPIGRLAALLLIVGVAVTGAASCSTANIEGPEVTCEDLQCGRINTCQSGIIAACLDGVRVVYHVCGAAGSDVCSQYWQVEGQYKCDMYGLDCEGCDPDHPGCPMPDPDAGNGTD